MIRVRQQPPPKDFDVKVRSRGMKALVRYRPNAPVPSQFWKGKEYWREAIDELFEAYGRICAFAAMRIEPVTGSRSVEHFKPKTLYPGLAYVWENYRLVCGMMNGRKGEHEDVLDPFVIPELTFDLNPISCEVLVHAECPSRVRAKAQSTIERLKLNDAECCRARQEHRDRVLQQHWSFSEGLAMSPFVIGCLERQGLIKSAK